MPEKRTAEQREQVEIWDPASIAKRIHVPTYDEILEKIRSRYPARARYRRLYEAEIARLQTVYNILISKTNFIRELVNLLDNLHPFFWDLVEIEYDRTEISAAIRCVSKSRKLASQFWEKYRFLLMGAETPREIKKVGAEARGRIMSTIKRCRRSLEILRSIVIFLSKLPAINPSMPTILVAGAPSTGKSTFVATASRARPKVSPFPFTTKNVHVGHTVIRGISIQVVDTPGLLDRPFTEMNYIERRAMAALRSITGPVVLLIDVSPNPSLELDRQFKIIDNIIKLNKNIYVFINKIDIADDASLAFAKREAIKLKELGIIREYFLGSAISQESVRSLIKSIAALEGWSQEL